jgi:dihydroorotase
VNPPLRSEEDRLALIAAILDGTVDAIATDHAPHTQADKEAGAPGFTGLETAFAVCYSTLVSQTSPGGRTVPEGIDLSRLSALMSAEPARILGLGSDRGLITQGRRADIAIVDPAKTWMINTAEFHSRGKNSPFAGTKLSGRIVMTIHGGNIVYELQHG